MPKKIKEFPLHLHAMINPEQYEFLSRHGVFARSGNIRILINKAIAEEKKQIAYIQECAIMSMQVEKMEAELQK